MRYERITIDPAICGGKPCIRGLRFPVSRLLGLLASGEDRSSILKNYPYLEEADIDETLRYAADLAEDETISTPVEVYRRHAVAARACGASGCDGSPCGEGFGSAGGSDVQRRIARSLS